MNKNVQQQENAGSFQQKIEKKRLKIHCFDKRNYLTKNIRGLKELLQGLKNALKPSQKCLIEK